MNDYQIVRRRLEHVDAIQALGRMREALERERAAGEAICARSPRCSGTHDCILPGGHIGFHSPRWDWFVEARPALADQQEEKPEIITLPVFDDVPTTRTDIPNDGNDDIDDLADWPDD